MIILVALYNIALFITFLNPDPRQSQSTSAVQLSDNQPWKPKSLVLDIPAGEPGEKIKYGYLLVTETAQHIGPGAIKQSMRFAGNNLTCNNCHLDAGRKIGAGSFVGVTNRFPQFRGRENKIGTIEDRINGCMERSMNGIALDINSNEMQAIVAYMEWLSENVPPEIDELYEGYTTINLPEVKADTVTGKKLYITICARCHEENGEGVKSLDNPTKYIYPPLGGFDSFNDGAGMNRVITAAEFIKGNMPFGETSPRGKAQPAFQCL
jgi:thiosulfate dehydrogenase